jgi:phage terminase small subunit
MMMDITAELKRDNPMCRDIEIEAYANALKAYVEASENIEKNGVICLHPRTGTPFENPYVKIQSQQFKVLSSLKKVKSNRVLAMMKTQSKR